MKKQLVLILFILNIHDVFAQSIQSKWNIMASAGISQYAGDITNDILNVNEKILDNNSFIGISLRRYINNSFDLSFNSNIGAVGYYKGPYAFKQTIVNFSANIKYKIANNYLLESSSFIKPFVNLGFGFDRYNLKSEATTKTPLDGLFQLGVGLEFPLSPQFSINIQSNFFYTSADNRDKRIAGIFNDAYMIESIGIAMNLSSKTDSDKDGIIDSKDHCPNTPIFVKVTPNGCPFDSDKDGIADDIDKCPLIAGSMLTNGCPDADKDGVADEIDECPQVKGLVKFNGCPDTDEDGIPDFKDHCPQIKGTINLMGCPDTDLDGITDSADHCPYISGLPQLMGCPDTDGDGIMDSEDLCPDRKGLQSNKGCPDSDNDGVYDDIDKCPKVAGLLTNNGCPAVKPVHHLFTKAQLKIKMNSKTNTIKLTEYKKLNQIIDLMKINPAIHISITGYTNNQLNENQNIIQSKECADKVTTYFINQGISVNRIVSQGLGSYNTNNANQLTPSNTNIKRVEIEVFF